MAATIYISRSSGIASRNGSPLKSLEPASRLWPSFRVISRGVVPPELLELIDKSVLSLWNYGRAIVFIGNEKSMQIPSPLWIMEIIFGKETITTTTTTIHFCVPISHKACYLCRNKVYVNEGFFCIYEKWKSVRGMRAKNISLR